jgi:hypothetical protein
MYFIISLSRQILFMSTLLLTAAAWQTAAEAAILGLAWSDNSNNEDGFKIERRSPGGSFVEVARVGANVTTYTDSNLAAGAAYCYTVRAFNSAGSSDATNAACGTTESNVGGTGSSGGTPKVASSPNFNSMLMLAKTSDSASTRASVQATRSWTNHGCCAILGPWDFERSSPTALFRIDSYRPERQLER